MLWPHDTFLREYLPVLPDGTTGLNPQPQTLLSLIVSLILAELAVSFRYSPCRFSVRL